MKLPRWIRRTHGNVVAIELPLNLRKHKHTRTHDTQSMYECVHMCCIMLIEKCYAHSTEAEQESLTQ